MRPDTGNDRGNCGKCGQTHRPLPKCQGHSKRTGLQCGGNAIPGTDKCKWHSGGEAKARAKGKAALEKVEAHKILAKIGVPVPIGNLDFLEAALAEANGNLAVLRVLVQSLPVGDHGRGLWEPTYHHSGRPTGEAKPHVVKVMYDDALAFATQLAIALTKLDFDARRVQLAEAQMARFGECIDAGLAALPEEQREVFRVAFVAALRSRMVT